MKTVSFDKFKRLPTPKSLRTLLNDQNCRTYPFVAWVLSVVITRRTRRSKLPQKLLASNSLWPFVFRKKTLKQASKSVVECNVAKKDLWRLIMHDNPKRPFKSHFSKRKTDSKCGTNLTTSQLFQIRKVWQNVRQIWSLLCQFCYWLLSFDWTTQNCPVN